MTDCAQWLNGRGVGARYDGTYNVNGQGSSYIGSCAGKYSGTVSGLGLADHNNIKSFIHAQIVAYEKADGWVSVFEAFLRRSASTDLRTDLLDLEDGGGTRVGLPGSAQGRHDPEPEQLG